MGMGADLVVVDGNFEEEVAKNHARWIGREFDPAVLPVVQKKIVERTRRDHPTLFSNDTINYPKKAQYIVDTQSAKQGFIHHRVKDAKSFDDIDKLMDEPFMKTRKLGNYFEGSVGARGEGEEEALLPFEHAAMRIAMDLGQNATEMGEEQISKYTESLDTYTAYMRNKVQQARAERLGEGEMEEEEFGELPVFPGNRPDVSSSPNPLNTQAEREAHRQELRTRARNSQIELEDFEIAVRREQQEAAREVDRQYEQLAERAYSKKGYGAIQRIPMASRPGKRSASAIVLEKLHQFQKDFEEFENRHRTAGTTENVFVPSFSLSPSPNPNSSQFRKSQEERAPGHAAAVHAALLFRDEESRDEFL
jgi:hypothetical protein